MLRAMRYTMQCSMSAAIDPAARGVGRIHALRQVGRERDERTAEILEKCGEPQKKDVSHEDVYARNPTGLHEQDRREGDGTLALPAQQPARCRCW